MQYKSYSLQNFKTIPQIKNLTGQQIMDIEVVGSVLPFRVNEYVVENLIDWDNVPEDPAFISSFPHRHMLLEKDYEQMRALIEAGASDESIKRSADEIRLGLNPHPAGQIEYNTPLYKGKKLLGIQHKYSQTLLIFPEQGQSCHSFCTFCFRWPQFAHMDEYKIATPENGLIHQYISDHPEITDVLITGGDPLIMKTEILAGYIEPLLSRELPHVRNIRIGTRALSWWPYRFLTDDDADDLLNLFGKIHRSGKHLALMANFVNPVELETEAVKEAITRVQKAGAIIRTQAPLLKNINASPEVWTEMWKKQVSLNCIPYYMFVARDTGAKHFFSVPLVEAWQIYRQAYQSVSGICRTVRGPSMSCMPGKVQVLGVTRIGGEKVFALNMIQARNPDWALRPFFAAYDETATWFDDLKPAFGEDRFFFSDELDGMLESGETWTGYE